MTKFLEKICLKISNVVTTKPLWIAVLAFLLAIISGIYSLFFLKLDTNQDNLISNSEAYHQRYLDYLDKFGDLEYVYVVFKLEENQKETAKKAVLKLVSHLTKYKNLFTEFHFKEDLNIFKGRGLLLLPQTEFETTIENIKNSELSEVKNIKTWDALIRKISDSLEVNKLKENQNKGEDQINWLHFVLDSMTHPEKLESLNSQDFFNKLTGQNLSWDEDGFYLSPNGKLLFLKILPAKDYTSMDIIKEPLEVLREKIQLIRSEYPSLHIGITGRPVLQSDEMNSTGTDSISAGIASFLAVAFLFFIFFRSFKKPLLSLTALLFGICYSTGWIALTLGHLNLLSLVFAIILVGLGIDYGIHFLFRYQNFRKDKLCVKEAIKHTLVECGPALMIGGISSAIAFFTALGTNFLGLKEFGFVAGSGIIFCLLSQIIILPAFIILADKENTPVKKVIPLKVFEFLLRRSTLIGLIVFTIIIFPFVKETSFEHNLLKLQNPDLESVRFEKIILDDSSISTWEAAFLTDNLERLGELQNKLKDKKSISYLESVLSFVPQNQEEKIKAIQNLNLQISQTDYQSHLINISDLTLNLNELHQKLQKLEELSFRNGKLEAVEVFEKLMVQIENIQKNNNEALFQKTQDLFFKKLNDGINTLAENLNPTPMHISQLPDQLKNRYISQSGQYVLYAYPQKNIWDEKNLDEFIRDIKSVDQNVTGSPVQVYESKKRMTQGFYFVVVITIIIIFILLLVDFKNLKDSMIALTPLFFGTYWLFGLMKIFNIDLSLGNFFALPILFGVGVDHGVHLIHHYRHHHSLKKMLSDLQLPILLSTLTTCAGFGMMSFVSHKGLASFGQMMTIGSLTILLASIVLVPLILKSTHEKIN